jgi:hypothetical protein
VDTFFLCIHFSPGFISRIIAAMAVASVVRSTVSLVNNSASLTLLYAGRNKENGQKNTGMTDVRKSFAKNSKQIM